MKKISTLFAISLALSLAPIAANATSYVYDYCSQQRHAVTWLSQAYPSHQFSAVDDRMTYLSSPFRDFFRGGKGRVTFFVSARDEAGRVYYVRTRHGFGGEVALCDLREAGEVPASLAQSWFQ